MQNHKSVDIKIHEDVTVEQVKQILDKITFTTCGISQASIFPNEKYDVLKFDMLGMCLHLANDELKKLPFTSEYPKYHPHMTVAYLKPGAGKKYTNNLSKKAHGRALVPTNVIFSQPNGKKTQIEIKVK